MNTLGKLFMLAALGLTVFNTAASAEPRPHSPNIMIVGEDADKDTIPRFNRNFNRIMRVVTEQLVAQGFRVFDETALTMDSIPQGGVRRELPELLATARIAGQKVRVPVDYVLVFQIYASVRQVPHVRETYQPFVRIDGRMINVRSGRDMGGYEFGSDFELMTISADCVHSNPPNECLLEEVGNQARDLGASLGKGLALKLAAYLPRVEMDPGLPPDLPPGPPPGRRGRVAAVPPPPGERPVCDGFSGEDYVLRIKDFDGQDLNRLEEAFTGFACYQHHRVLTSLPGRTEYSYETTADQARVVRNLRFALDYMNLPGSVAVTDGGRTIIVERLLIAPPGVIPLPPGVR
jgi:hypothetical protein